MVVDSVTPAERVEVAAEFKVEVLFTGLCGFVKSVDSKYLRVVLVNAKDEPLEHGNSPHEPHEAVLIIDAANVDEEDPSKFEKEKFFRFVKVINKKDVPVWVFPLNGVDLSFSDDKPGTGFVFHNRRDKGCPVEDIKSFDWIAKMEDVGAGEMKQDALTGRDEGLVSARFRFSGGELSTVDFRRVNVEEGGQKWVSWRFEEANGEYVSEKRPLSEEVLLSFKHDALAGPWGIKFDHFDQRQKTTVKLKPSKGIVRMWVQNMPLLNVLGVFGGDSEAPDEHFVHFYKLCVGGDYHSMIPHARSRCTPPTTGLTGPKCPVALFADHESV